MSSRGCSSSGCLVEVVAWIVELVAGLLIITVAIFRGELLPAAELADKKPARTREQIDKEVKPVIDEVDQQCRDRTVYMIGPEKAKRLAELVREKKPRYFPCFKGIETKLAKDAVVVADNVGIGAASMADYLKLVRSKYRSRTEWFDLDLPWEKRDAIEITRLGAARE